MQKENRFTNAVGKQLNITSTENGQFAYKSTAFSKVLDFYAVAGALRTRSEDEIKTKMAEAFNESPLLATRLLFHLSDIREGLGERRTFRIALEWLANNHPEVVEFNLKYIAHFNRWDSLFTLKGTPCEDQMVRFVHNQLISDLTIAIQEDAKESISLLAKWLPSINTSSAKTRELGAWFARRFGLTSREYRQSLAFLREYLRVVEVKMSNKEWSSIDYSQVPANAMMRYRKAYRVKDAERFQSYLEKVRRGEAKINAGTLFPYDIIEKIMHREKDAVLEAQWKALPNYIDGAHNVLVMADVSGSMQGRPMATSVGLAIYFAERNSGPYKDLFMTFSSVPEFVKLQGHDLYTRVHNAMNAKWNMNTNLEAAFLKVLDLAIRNNLKTEDLPKAIVVISDMEIDAACYAARGDFLSGVREKYARFGYQLPKLIFWNVNSRNDTFLVDSNRPGVELASGQSASTFRSILKSVSTTPYMAMLEVLNGERYLCVTLPTKYSDEDDSGASFVAKTGWAKTAPAKKVPTRSLADIRTTRAQTIKKLFAEEE